MDASYIIYTGVSTPNIPITPGQNLQTILGNIDSAINTMSAAPDYTPFDLQCLRPTYTITDTQEFAEAVADFLCSFKSAYDTFVGTTYVTDQGVITAAINALQLPALTYDPVVAGATPFGIINTDTVQQFYSKLFTGLDAIIAAADPSTASWASLPGPPPTPLTVADAFDYFITELLSIQAALPTYQPLIPEVDNSANCLATVGGTSADDAEKTLNLLSAYICMLPTLDTSGYTWGCVSPASTLDDIINNIMASITQIGDNFIATASTGLLTSSNGSCGGYDVEIDPDWEGLFKVAVDLADAQGGTADYLAAKVISSDSSVTIAASGTNLDLTVTTPADGKVKATSTDPTADYLESKITTTASSWGVSLSIAASSTNDSVVINPVINNPELFIQNMITTIAGDTDLMAQFCSLIAQCSSCNCAAPTALVVTAN